MCKRFVTILAAGIIISATAAFAGVQAEQFYLSPVIGGYSFEGGQHLATSPLFGARVGYNVTRNLGIEALFDYAGTEKTRVNSAVSMFRYGADVLYHFMPENTFVPYIAAGFSGIVFDGHDINKSGRGAFDYGIGAKYFLNDSFALRGDVRHIITGQNSALRNNIEYTLGAYIPFGGAAPAVKPLEPPPAKVLLDSDGDGVTDNLDSCPGTPKGVAVDASGCPLDSDKDGVPDYLDQCPDTPIGTKVDSRGCPEVVKSVEVAKSSEVARKTEAGRRFCNKPAVINITFDTDKANIKPGFKKDLDKLAEFLKEFPTAKGEIAGHTDNVGSKKYNAELSLRRASSARTYLEKTYGIAPQRITVKGYGFSRPVASNKSEDGKSRNRRIETNFNCE